MTHKFGLIYFVAAINIILTIRIPSNPCPNIFKYYKNSQGKIYGEVKLPYDASTELLFAINASFLGNFHNPKLKLEMRTTVGELNNYTPEVVFNVFFPFENVIPRITAIHLNGILYCSGPPEPIIINKSGITGVWSQLSFSFTRGPPGSYNTASFLEPGTSDYDIPIKNPSQSYYPPVRTPTEIPPVVINLDPKQFSLFKDESPSQLFDQQSLTPWNLQVEESSTDSTKKSIQTSEILPPEINLDPTKFPITEDDKRFINKFFSDSRHKMIADKHIKCGVSSEDYLKTVVPFIHGGTDTSPGEFPWLVAMYINDGSKFDYKCSANLISDRHVLTAARCVFDKNRLIKTENILLVMGINDLNNWDDAKTKKAMRIIVHPDFKSNLNSAHGDLALITMDDSISFSNVARPVCLWNEDSEFPTTKKSGVLVGYGQDEESQKNNMNYSFKAKKAFLPIVSQDECFSSRLGFTSVTSEQTFCTKTSDGQIGPCLGDSGSGLYYFINNAFYLRGLATVIFENNGICDLSRKYSVFFDIVKFTNWIKSNMK